MSDNARTEAVKPEWLKAWLVLREGRLRDLDSNDPGWPSGVEMFVVGFNAGASRKVEAAPSDTDREALIAEAREVIARVNPEHHDALFQYKGGVMRRETICVLRDVTSALEAVLAPSQPVQVEHECEFGCSSDMEHLQRAYDELKAEYAEYRKQMRGGA